MKFNTKKVTFDGKEYTFSDDFKYIRLADVVKNVPSGNFIYTLGTACSQVTKDEITVVVKTEEEGESKYMNFDNVSKHFIKALEGPQSRTSKSSMTTIFRHIQAIYDFIAGTEIPVTPSQSNDEIEVIYRQLAKLEIKLGKQEKAQTLMKEIKELKEQLALSEAKAEELRQVNLTLANENGLLKTQVKTLESFKNKILGATQAFSA